jgi:hypothetical protein
MVTTSTNASRPSSSSTASLLHDQLAQFNGSGSASGSASVSGRSVLGWFLTFCGLGVSGWVLFAIHATIFHPERIGLPLRLVKIDELVMSIPSGKIQLPVVGVNLVAYLLTVLLLAIAGKIAMAMLKLGASLVLGEKVMPTRSGRGSE